MLNHDEILKIVDALRRRKPVRLNEIISRGAISQNKICNKGGVYAFWWCGNQDDLKEKLLFRNYPLKGPGGKEITIRFSEDWIKRASFQDRICLYVGKSTNMRKRVSGHLRLKTENLWNGSPTVGNKKPNTVSQLRIGIERIFDRNMRDEIISNVALTWEVLDGEEHCVNRFYLENLVIGTYYPIFNVDIER